MPSDATDPPIDAAPPEDADDREEALGDSELLGDELLDDDVEDDLEDFQDDDEDDDDSDFEYCDQLDNSEECDDFADDEDGPPEDDSPTSGDTVQGETEAAPTSCEVSGRSLVDDVQIALNFDVGQTRMNLNQLRRLLPGYLFELATHVESPVAIKVYGQTIGRGELVQIGERLGVRLLEIDQDAS